MKENSYSDTGYDSGDGSADYIALAQVLLELLVEKELDGCEGNCSCQVDPVASEEAFPALDLVHLHEELVGARFGPGSRELA